MFGAIAEILDNATDPEVLANQFWDQRKLKPDFTEADFIEAISCRDRNITARQR